MVSAFDSVEIFSKIKWNENNKIYRFTIMTKCKNIHIGIADNNTLKYKTKSYLKK